MSTRVSSSVLLANPANFLALGAGSGLAPVAPGTAGTIAAIPLLWIMPDSVPAYLLVLLIMFVVGIWVCESCTQYLGVHDHSAIVWDEWVGYLITMIAVPRQWQYALLGFALFRLFDVWKPWPIRVLDQKVHGGLGIMIDDVLAACFAAVVVQLFIYFV